MSKKLFLLPALFLSAMIMFAPACGDKCGKKDCGNGICDEVDGSCNCDPGYEYDADGSCKVLTQDKYVHIFTVSENCSATPYLAEIVRGSGVTDVLIKNVWDVFQNSVKATIDGNTITIGRQEPDNDGFFVEGSGTYSVNTGGKGVITLNYTVKDENVPSTGNTSCTATYTQQ